MYRYYIIIIYSIFIDSSVNMDFISSSKNVGSSAFGSSGNASASSSGGNVFSNLTIQKIVLILAVIAFIISISTVAILLWKSKNTQKWPPEIAKCPDRMEFDGTNCSDTYDLGFTLSNPDQASNCNNFDKVKSAKYSGAGLNGVDGGYIPWEGVVDGKESRASSLKCVS